jgi:hypothetical protein
VLTVIVVLFFVAEPRRKATEIVPIAPYVEPMP